MKETPRFCLSIPWNLGNFWKMRLNVYAGFSLPFGIIFCSALTGGFEPRQQWGVFVPAEEPRWRGLVCLGLRVHAWLKGSLSEAVAGGDGPGGRSPLTYILDEVLKLISWEAPCKEGHEQMPVGPEFPPASQFSMMLRPREHTDQLSSPSPTCKRNAVRNPPGMPHFTHQIKRWKHHREGAYGRICC